MFKKFKKRGQSTLEYLVLIAMVIAVLIIFLNPTGGVFQRAYDNTLKMGSTGMETMANRLSLSRPTSS